LAKKVIVSVTNDLYTDPRVDKVCNFLTNNKFDVLLVGRCYKNSPKLQPRKYQTKRLRLFFRKGSLFYAEFNLRLFFFLLFKKCDLLVANDLDTLLPNILISKFKRKEIVYDSHEYFTEMLSIADRPFVKKTWTRIERFCFPKLKQVITVSQSIADRYEETYGIKVRVVRNIPSAGTPPVTETRKSLNLPENKPIIILQGNGFNEGRGGEETVAAMQYVENALLLVVGSGTMLPTLKQMAKDLSLSDKIRFIDRVDFAMLYNYTYLSDIGIAPDKGLSLNLQYSLPNKIFEYIRAYTPIISSDLQERRKIIHTYNIGKTLEEVSPVAIAKAINEMMSDREQYQIYKENTKTASQELTWENEEKVLSEIYSVMTDD